MPCIQEQNRHLIAAQILRISRRRLPEKPFVQLITHTLAGKLAPFQTRLRVVIRDKPALLADRLHLIGKKVDLPAAVGTNLRFNRRRPDIIRARTSVRHRLSTLKLYHTPQLGTTQTTILPF
jgi:hypothetical protein